MANDKPKKVKAKRLENGDLILEVPDVGMMGETN